MYYPSDVGLLDKIFERKIAGNVKTLINLKSEPDVTEFLSSLSDKERRNTFTYILNKTVLERKRTRGFSKVPVFDKDDYFLNNMDKFMSSEEIKECSPNKKAMLVIELVGIVGAIIIMYFMKAI